MGIERPASGFCQPSGAGHCPRCMQRGSGDL